jgi:hypothetical protein
LICFCAACLCTAFGDLSPIIALPFGCWFAGPQHVHFTESDSRTVSSPATVVKPQMQFGRRNGAFTGCRHRSAALTPLHCRSFCSARSFALMLQ